MQVGYIEQSYRNCKDDGATNNDLCWFNDKSMGMVFGGHSTRLMKDDTTGRGTESPTGPGSSS
jgi:hypothetical protein